MLDTNPTRRAGVAGALAAVLGYAITLGARWSALQSATSAGGRFARGAFGPPAWKVAGWLWAGAHHVTFQASTDTIFLGVNGPVAPTVGAPWTPLLFAVPVALLVVAGALTAGGTGSPRAAAKRGAAVALGYAPVASLSLYAFRWTADYPKDAAYNHLLVVLDPVGVVVVMGCAFPVLFGAMGGRLRYALST